MKIRGSTNLCRNRNQIRIAFAFGNRDQIFLKKNGISYAKIYHITTLEYSNLVLTVTQVTPQDKPLVEMSLDSLLVGYYSGAVNNPDGQLLSGTLAEKESAMHLKPTQLAKGEKVLQTIDFINEQIV